MSFPPLEPPRVLLHVVIPGPPHTQQRHRKSTSKYGKIRNYDPSFDDKQAFLRELRCACPRLKPEMDPRVRIGVRLNVWSSKKPDKNGDYHEDNDNFVKFYLDALSPGRVKKRKLPKGVTFIPPAPPFAAWGNDSQVDDTHCRVYRSAVEAKIEIFVYVLNEPPK